MSVKKIEGWVLEYACKFYQHEVIAALYDRYGERLPEILEVSDVRLAAATIHRIIFCFEYEDFDTAVHLIEDLHALINDVCPPRVYFRLSYALKMKVLMDDLRSNTKTNKQLSEKLNEYFPRCGIVDFKHIKTSQKDLARVQEMVSDFRRRFLSLVINENQRKAYMQNDFETDYGCRFMASVAKHTTRFLEVIEGYLPCTVIEKMLQKGTEAICKNVPFISASVDILMECLVNKTSLKENDLLDILTLLHPLSTRDKLQPKRHLTFGSDDSCTLDNSLCEPGLHDDGTCPHESSQNSDQGHLSVLSISSDDQPAGKDMNLSVDNKDDEVSQPVSASGESVSIISRHRPDQQGQSKTRCGGSVPSGDESLSQVYVISSSSDSASNTQGTQEHVSNTSSSSLNGSFKDLPSDNSMFSQDLQQAMELSCQEDSMDKVNTSGNSCVIPSSNMEELQNACTDDKKSVALTYPSLRQHQKHQCVKLCVVKLYREQKLDTKLDDQEMQIYR